MSDPAPARVQHMNEPTMTIALITEVFFDDPYGHRLAGRLTEARNKGATLALLPELPMDPWIPATRTVGDDDAEDPGGPRHRTQAEAARRGEIAVWGGAIVRDQETGRRYNTSLLFDATGTLRSAYRKVHLPYEEGFWEAAHYEPGDAPPEVVTGFGLPLGVQICSDANRTFGFQHLAAQEAGMVFVPRATPEASYPRWRLVLRADAVTSAAWVVSVNRPRLEAPSPIGGPSVVIAPDGEVVLETTDPLAVISIDADAVGSGRRGYPGYLDYYPDLYADGWRQLTDCDSTDPN
jgi:predicted amidohydrolase